jgi:sodium/bile acid cotransporter 7
MCHSPGFRKTAWPRWTAPFAPDASQTQASHIFSDRLFHSIPGPRNEQRPIEACVYKAASALHIGAPQDSTPRTAGRANLERCLWRINAIRVNLASTPRRTLLARNWFLAALALDLLVGFWLAGHLAPLTQRLPRGAMLATVLFAMALPLDASTLWLALRRPTAVLLAVLINLGLLPLVGWGVSTALRPDLGLGLVIASSIPTTLASCVVLTRRAGGNDAVALMVSLAANLVCFLVTPFWLAVATGARVDAEPLRPQKMVVELGLLVVIPILLAQVLRLYGPIGRQATSHKIALGVVGQCGMLTMVLIGAVQAGLKLAGRHEAISALDWGAMLLAVCGVHLSMLACGLLGSRWLGIARPEQVAVGLAGSQKTLMVGLHIALAPPFNSGLAMLPMVAYHISQLLLDTLIADRLRPKTDASTELPPAE